MRKKLTLIFLLAIITANTTLVSCKNSDNIENKTSKTYAQSSTVVNTTIEPTTQKATENLLSVYDSLNEKQKQLLPFYNNGYSFEGDGVKYLGKTFIDDTFINDSQTHLYLGSLDGGGIFWAILNNQTLYYKGDKSGSRSTNGKYLFVYDRNDTEPTVLREWSDLEKYGDVKYIISDNKNLLMIFKAAEWYNIVKIDQNGNDELLSKISFDNSANTSYFEDENFVEVSFPKTLIQTGNEYEFYYYGTMKKQSDEYYVKYKVNFKTGDYECVDKIPNPKDEDGFIFLPISMCFLPDNNYYFAKKIEVENELTGYKELKTEIYETERTSGETKKIAIIDGTIGEAYLTDKYIVFDDIVLELSTGNLIEKDDFSDDFYYIISHL